MKHSVTVQRFGSNYIVKQLTNRTKPGVGTVVYEKELEELISEARKDDTLTVIVKDK